MRLARIIRAHPDAASALTLIVLPILVFGRALMPGKVLSSADVLFTMYPWRGLAPGLRPGNDLLTDPAHLFQPWLIYAVNEVWQGRIPLWNPHVFAGSPFFANPQSALLFPLNWVALIVPITWAFALIAILKVAAIGLATYWFLRVRALHPFAALMGAISFMWSGVVIVWLQWTYAATLIFLPMLFASVECLRIRPGRRAIALVALSVALGVLAGYPQGLALALALASAWALWRAHGAGVPFLWRFAAGVALGVSLAAIQLLPFIEYTRLSAVLAAREAWMPPLSASFRSVISLLVPYYYGSPTGGDYWGEWNFNETAVSVGLAPWLLMPLALIARRPGVLFFSLMAIGAGLQLYGLGPELANAGSFVINFRVAPLLAFSLCVLGAIGMDTLLTEPDRPSLRQRAVVRIAFVAVVAVVFLSFTADYATMRRLGLAAVSPVRYVWFLTLFTTSAALCLIGLSRRGSAWAFALLGVQFVGLAPLALSYNPVIDARLLYPTTPALVRLQQEVVEAPGRVLMAPNLAMLYGLEGVAAYDGMTPRHLDEAIRPETSALNLLGSGYVGEISVFWSPVRDLLGIRYILVPPEVAVDRPGLSLRYHGADGRIYRNEAALPRAFVVAEARCLDTAEVLKRIRARAVDFRREVLLTDCVDATPGDARSPRTDASSPGTARIERYSADHVRISAESDRGGYLVLTDSWFPGWTANVDGRETRVERADHAFRAVKLGPGHHDVEFRYAPTSVRLGLALSALAAIVTGALAWPGTASWTILPSAAPILRGEHP
jgi:membrane protein YfhO